MGNLKMEVSRVYVIHFKKGRVKVLSTETTLEYPELQLKTFFGFYRKLVIKFKFKGY